MGRETKTITVTVSVSRHNSDQDRIDDEAAGRLHELIIQACDTVVAEYPEAFYYSPLVDGP